MYNFYFLRLAIGNGLRREVWEKFQKKFDIDLICEFYGASEGAGGLLNVFHEVGKKKIKNKNKNKK